MISLWMAVLLLMSLAIPAFAMDSGAPWVVDNANLLTADENAGLTEKIRLLRDELQIDVVIVTTWTTDGQDLVSYADDFYERNGYGYGSDNSGILFLLDMGSRQWYMSTCGEAVDLFPDDVLDDLEDRIVNRLSTGDYYGAFYTWLDSLSYYVERYRLPNSSAGYGYDSGYSYQTEMGRGLQIGIPVLIGLVAAFLTIFIMRSQMNTAKFQKGAADYLKNGSFRLSQHLDLYLYSRVSKTPRPKNTSPGGSSRGASHRSSTHRSSGGVRHGGRGGRF